jgi:hypothetical protein
MSDEKANGGADLRTTARDMSDLVLYVNDAGLKYVSVVVSRNFVAAARGESRLEDAVGKCVAARERANGCMRLALEGRFADAMREATAMTAEASS